MVAKYLVGDSEATFDERQFVLVEAQNATAAEAKFLKHYVQTDKIFHEYVYDKFVNASVAERFSMQGDEVRHFEATGEFIIDDDEFKRRAREFFGDHSDFAELYIDHWFSESDQPEMPFPIEMLMYILLEDPNWMSIEVISLDDIDKI